MLTPFESSANGGGINPLNDGFLVTVRRDSLPKLKPVPCREYLLEAELWKVIR